MGRPPKEIDWNLVEIKLQAKCSVEEIIPIFNIDDSTFYRRFEQEYGEGFQGYREKFHSVGKGKIKQTQYEKALEGNAQMLILLGKEWLDQDKHNIDIPPRTNEVDKENQQMNENHRLRLENEQLRKQLDNQPKTGSELLRVESPFQHMGGSSEIGEDIQQHTEIS